MISVSSKRSLALLLTVLLLCTINFSRGANDSNNLLTLTFVGLDRRDDSGNSATTLREPQAAGSLLWSSRSASGFLLDDTTERVDIYITPEASVPLTAKRRQDTTATARLDKTSKIFTGNAIDEYGAPVLVSLAETQVYAADGASGAATSIDGYVLFENVHYTIRGSYGNPIRVTRQSALDYLPEEEVKIEDDRRALQGVRRQKRRLDAQSELISVLVAFPSDAACHIAGLPDDNCDTNDPGVKSVLEAVVTNAVSLVNTAYANSDISVTMKIAGVSVVNEKLRGVSGTTQISMLRTGRSFLSLRRERDNVAADFVVLLTADLPGSCGIGMITENGDRAFSVVDFQCIPNQTFSHEIAHNMGSHHNIEDASDKSAGFAYGFRSPDDTFRTIMAYDCSSKRCPRIAYYSNPNVLYNGAPTGDVSANNAKWIQMNRSTYAKYRDECNFGFGWLFCILARFFRLVFGFLFSF